MKRILSAVLSGAMALSMAAGLSGCGGSKADTLTWYMTGDEPADLEMVMEKVNEIVEPELGLKLDMQYLDTASYAEKMKLKMASGEAFDLLFTGYLYPYQDTVALGGLYDITELAEQEGLLDVIPQGFIDSARIDGKLYAIPNVQVASNPKCFVIDQVDADVAGVDIEAVQAAALAYSNGTGTKEAYAEKLTDMFTKFKAAAPEKYVYQTGYLPFVAGRYEEVAEGIVIRKDGSSTKFEREIDTEDYKFGIEQQYNWYANGYIKSDIASAGTGTSSAEERDKISVQVGTWKPGQDESIKKSYAMEEPAYAFMHAPYMERAAALSTMTGVGANTKHPVEAVKFLKMINTNVELYNLIVFGIEGVHYNKDEDGKIVMAEDTGYDMSGMAWALGNQFNAYLMAGQEDGVWEETEKMNDEAIKSPLLGFVPDFSNVSSEMANLSTIRAEYFAKTDYCTEDPANWWDEYVAKLEQAGIDKVLAELQSQYDAFLASNN